MKKTKKTKKKEMEETEERTMEESRIGIIRWSRTAETPTNWDPLPCWLLSLTNLRYLAVLQFLATPTPTRQQKPAAILHVQ